MTQTQTKSFEKENFEHDEFFPLTRFIPSIVTLTGLCFGLSSIKYALAANYNIAIIFIIVAAFFDGIDGRIARAFKTSSEFGASLDSLCDLVNFGIAPSLILYFWLLDEIKFFGWATVLFTVMCMTIRLARFNSMLNDKDLINPLKNNYFVGVPSPMAACLLLTPLMIAIESGFLLNINKYFVVGYSFMISFLMISRIPTPSLKGLKISKKNISIFIFIIPVIIIFIIHEPFKSIIFFSLSYLLFVFYLGLKHSKLVTKKLNA